MPQLRIYIVLRDCKPTATFISLEVLMAYFNSPGMKINLKQPVNYSVIENYMERHKNFVITTKHGSNYNIYATHLYQTIESVKKNEGSGL